MANMCVFYALEVFPLTAHTKDPLLSNNTTAALLGFVVHLPHCRNGYLRIVNYGGGRTTVQALLPLLPVGSRGGDSPYLTGGGGEGRFVRSLLQQSGRREFFGGFVLSVSLKRCVMGTSCCGERCEGT